MVPPIPIRRFFPTAEVELWHHSLHHVEKASGWDLRPRRSRNVEKVSRRGQRSPRYDSRHPLRSAAENLGQERFHERSRVRAFYGGPAPCGGLQGGRRRRCRVRMHAEDIRSLLSFRASPSNKPIRESRLADSNRFPAHYE